MFTATLVRVQEIDVPNVRICVHDLPEQARVEIDGLLGMSFLEHTIFTFDFKSQDVLDGGSVSGLSAA